jgi:hypothetical protein
MSYRLLIAIEVLDFTQGLPRRDQQALWKRFREIAETLIDSSIIPNAIPGSGYWMSMSTPGSRFSFGRTPLTGT